MSIKKWSGLPVRIRVNIHENADLEYVESLIGELPNYLETHLFQRLLPVAQQAASRAAQYCPRRTGLLQASIHAVVEANGVSVEADMPYALFVEYGTKYQLPKMFINSAMEEHYDLIRDTIKYVILEYFETVKA